MVGLSAFVAKVVAKFGRCDVARFLPLHNDAGPTIVRVKLQLCMNCLSASCNDCSLSEALRSVRTGVSKS
jgi:hypothetical protein